MKHPLVQFHGLSPSYMNLVRAHHMVEAGHRHAAYDMVLNYATEPEQQQAVLDSLNEGLKHWRLFRDGIARACGLRES
jgi:pyrroloquinoline-quinone synthase